MRERRSTACGTREPMSCLSTGPPARSSINIATLRRAKGTPTPPASRAMRECARSGRACARCAPVPCGRDGVVRLLHVRLQRSVAVLLLGPRTASYCWKLRPAGRVRDRQAQSPLKGMTSVHCATNARVAVRVGIAGPVERLRRPVQALVPIVGEDRPGVCGGGQAECQAGERAGDRGCRRLRCAPRSSRRYEGPGRMSRRAGAIEAEAPAGPSPGVR